MSEKFQIARIVSQSMGIFISNEVCLSVDICSASPALTKLALASMIHESSSFPLGHPVSLHSTVIRHVLSHRPLIPSLPKVNRLNAWCSSMGSGSTLIDREACRDNHIAFNMQYRFPARAAPGFAGTSTPSKLSTLDNGNDQNHATPVPRADTIESWVASNRSPYE